MLQRTWVTGSLSVLVMLVALPVVAQTTSTPTATPATVPVTATPTPGANGLFHRPLLSAADRAKAHADFAAKIQQRLDARRQAIALRAVERLKTLNTLRTTIFTDRLTFLTAILSKITARADALEKQG